MDTRSAIPRFDSPAILTAVLLTQAEALMSRALGRSLAAHDMSWPQALSLFVLAEHRDPVSATHLVDHLGLGRTAMTSVVDRLERQRWVERQSWPADRRVTHLVLTDAGRGVLDALRPLLHGTIEGYFSGLDAHQLAEWTDAIARLITMLRTLGPEAPAQD